VASSARDLSGHERTSAGFNGEPNGASIRGLSEAGKPTAEFGLLLRVLDALGLGIELTAHDRGTDAASTAVDLDAVIDGYRA
jgi:hypothetical protein